MGGDLSDEAWPGEVEDQLSCPGPLGLGYSGVLSPCPGRRKVVKGWHSGHSHLVYGCQAHSYTLGLLSTQ